MSMHPKNTDDGLLCAYAIPGLKHKKAVERKKIPIDKIIMLGGQFFNLDLSWLTGRQRDRYIVEPRMLIMFYLRRDCKFSLAEVGRRFNRDHTTVMHAMKQVDDLFTTQPEIKAHYNEMITYIEYHGLFVKK